MAGLKEARLRGRKGDRKFALSKAAMARRETSVAELSGELGVGRVTFYPYVDPGGALRENGRRVLAELGVLGGGQVYDRFFRSIGRASGNYSRIESKQAA